MDERAANGCIQTSLLLISTMTLGLALINGVYVGLSVIVFHNSRVIENIFSVLIIVILVYMVGWVIALIAIRLFNNLLLPYVVSVYAWATLAGAVILYSLIILVLFRQEYFLEDFIRYVFVMIAVLIPLFGFHLLIKDHDLRPFSIPLLGLNLIHLYVIDYRYKYTLTAKYNYLSTELIFFFGMSAISLLMLLRLGIFNNLRAVIDAIFEGNPNDDSQ